jgi:hypothetical protein
MYDDPPAQDLITAAAATSVWADFNLKVERTSVP